MCLRRPLARRQQKLVVPTGRDAARTRLRAPADAGGTRLGRVSDAVFDKLFLGGTLNNMTFFENKMAESNFEGVKSLDF